MTKASDELEQLRAERDALKAENATLWKVVGTTVAKVEVPPEEASSVLTEKDRARVQKEIQGLEAKLRWPHIEEGVKDVYRARIAALHRQDS